MDRQELREILSKNEAIVTFIKTDGSKREMRCTLKEEVLPPLKGTSNRKKSKEVLPVWDLENNGWRSFRLDSIITVKELKND